MRGYRVRKSWGWLVELEKKHAKVDEGGEGTKVVEMQSGRRGIGRRKFSKGWVGGAIRLGTRSLLSRILIERETRKLRLTWTRWRFACDYRESVPACIREIAFYAAIKRLIFSLSLSLSLEKRLAELSKVALIFHNWSWGNEGKNVKYGDSNIM